MDEKWKEKAKDIIAWQVIYDAGNLAEIMKKDIAAALAEAHAEGRKAGMEEAAIEAESWWPLFHFDSFDKYDVRRAANPNQIATRIRFLKDAPEGK